jgi:peptidoglycan/LPS O-acetylase OafA/YrhL
MTCPGSVEAREYNQPHAHPRRDARRGGVGGHHLPRSWSGATVCLERWLPQITSHIVHYAFAGIYLFFVISGFCIHLHWARTRAAGIQEPVINFGKFWKRRVRRLYPPYFVALALYVVYIAYKTPVNFDGFYIWDVVLHLFMLHNLDPRTVYTINGAFWTLAIEEQLYLAYFLLLFLRIRYGWTKTLLLCFSARVVWLLLSRGLSEPLGFHIPLTEAAATNWFIWALGALSVEAAVGVTKLPRWCFRISIGSLALGCAVALSTLLPMVDQTSWLHDIGWLIMHPAWGVGFFVFVNYAVVAEQRWRQNSSRVPHLISALAAIGLISYSLYLTHSFVLMHWYWFGFTEWHIRTISLVITMPLSVVFAWLFFRLFERPFMTSATAKVREKSKPAPVDAEEITLVQEAA